MLDNFKIIENEYSGGSTETPKAIGKTGDAPAILKVGSDMDSSGRETSPVHDFAPWKSMKGERSVHYQAMRRFRRSKKPDECQDAIQTRVGARLEPKIDEIGMHTHDRARRAARATSDLPDDDKTRAPRLTHGRNIMAALDARLAAAEDMEKTLFIERMNAARNYSSNIYQNVPAIICEIDGDGITTFANPAFEKVSGYSRDELIGKNWLKLLHPEEEYVEVERLFNAFEGGAVVDYEMRLTRKNGDKRDIVWNILDERDGADKITKIIGFGNDITDLKRAAEEPRRLRHYLSNIIDSIPSVLIGVDSDAKVTQWNREAARSTGVSVEEALGRPLDRIFPRLSEEMERVREAMRTRKARANFRHAHKEDGETRYENVSIYPLIAGGEEDVEGAVIRVDDVTGQVRIEEMMVQSEKMLSVGGLAAGMAHEINNPLAAILQNAYVVNTRLTSTDMPANQRAARAAGVSMESIHAFMEARGIVNMIQNIRESGARAAEIVTNMLGFARKSESICSTHDLAGLLDQTADLAGSDYDMKKQHDFRHIEIVREYEKDLPFIPCEPCKIQQVLLNLLRNGAQAMGDAGTENPRFIVRTRHEKERKMIRVEVEDNGPGMAEETRKRVFEPFYTTKPAGVGTGLGMSVSYFIITENHGGEMSVESTLGEGSKFIIRLPVERVEN